MNSKLYVGNLSAGITENNLRDLFSGKGSITSITLMIETTTECSRGFAFVTMATPEAAANAMKTLHGHPLGGRHITVTEARPQQETRAGTLIGDGDFRGFSPVRKQVHKFNNKTRSYRSQVVKPSRRLLQREPNPRQRILVVDDELFIREFCAEILIHFGYHVDVAQDGARAWEALQRKSYDLLITDNNMNGLTGIELIEKIFVSDMTLPVIMISGMMPAEELNQRPELQSVARLPKPFTADSLLAIVRKVLAVVPRPPMLLAV